jgi:hypothetical protein
MRALFVILAMMVTLVLSSCPLPSLPKADTAMLANGKPMQAIPWSDVNQTTVEIEMGINVVKPPSNAELEDKLNAGPWWIWPANEERLRLEFKLPLLWDSSVHGLYTTKQDVAGSKLLIIKQRLIQPSQTGSEGDKWSEYYWPTLWEKFMTDENYQTNSLYYMVVTPYEKGCYIVCFKDKLGNISK